MLSVYSGEDQILNFHVQDGFELLYSLSSLHVSLVCLLHPGRHPATAWTKDLVVTWRPILFWWGGLIWGMSQLSQRTQCLPDQVQCSVHMPLRFIHMRSTLLSRYDDYRTRSHTCLHRYGFEVHSHYKYVSRNEEMWGFVLHIHPMLGHMAAVAAY